MALIHRLLQEIDDDERQTGDRQCFISHKFGEDDLRQKLERALAQLGLHAYFADKEVTGEYILNKVCKKILLTRASIVDLTYANPNVYFELGVAIGLNKPVFIVRKGDAVVPPLLESFIKLRFTSYAALERDLIALAPGWLKESIEHHLSYNTHCHFVNVLCPDRQRLAPQRRYLVIDQLRQPAGAPAGDADLRAELQAALGGFQYAPVFLEDITPSGGFGLCDYCRALRDSSFALCHLTSDSSTDVYLLLGLFTGLGIPGLLVVKRERDEGGRRSFRIPSMLQGIDAFYYQRYKEIAERLGEEIDGFLKRYKHRPMAARRLIFPERERREPEKPRPEKQTEGEPEQITVDATKAVEGELEQVAAEATELIEKQAPAALEELQPGERLDRAALALQYEEAGDLAAAAQLYERAAQQAATQAPVDEERAAMHYERAALLYARIDNAERAAACRGQVRRYRRLPDIGMVMEADEAFVEYQWSEVRLRVENTGYETACDLTITLRGSFDVYRNRPIATLPPGRSEALELALRPQRENYGPRVPLEFVIEYRDAGGQSYQDVRLQSVQVAQQGAARGAVTPIELRMEDQGAQAQATTLDQEEIDHQLALLNIHRRNLALLLERRARVGAADVPVSLVADIDQARDEIRRLKTLLRSTGVIVDDHPVDEDLAANTPSPSRPVGSQPITAEEIEQQRELLATYRRTLAEYLKRVARMGGEAYATPATLNGIRESRENIRRIKSVLRAWDVQVDDHPDDEDPVAGTPLPASRVRSQPITAEEIEQQQELLTIHRRNLAEYLKQVARMGGEAYATPATLNGIRESRENIRRIKTTLREWNVIVDDHPDDGDEPTAPPSVTFAQPAPIPAPSVDRRALREAMLRAFSLEELDLLCDDVERDLEADGISLSINMELLGGEGKPAKILDLIGYLERRGYLEYLVSAVRRSRPGLI